MNTIIEIGTVVAIGALFAYLIIDNIITRLNNRALFVKAAQSQIDLLAATENMKEILKREAEGSQNNDGFLKFVSQSRDWAFEYIEEAQSSIKEFKDAVEPIVMSYELDRSAPVNNSDVDVIVEAYKKLIGVLPKDD